MNPKSPENLPKDLLKALNCSTYQQVENLISAGKADHLSFDDKGLLAQVFLIHGEELLKEATGSNEFTDAISALEKAIKLNPTSYQGYLFLAKAYLQLGIIKNEEELLIKSNQLFSQADILIRAQNQKMPLNSLWKWGLCLYFLAKHAEEAIDFKYALDKFREAYTQGFQNADFLLDFGTALAEFGMIIGKEEIIYEATQYLETSLKEKGDHQLTWLRLACAYKILYYLTGDVAFFEKADQSFLAVARLGEDDAILWSNWGQLLSMEGKLTRDISLLQSAQEKLEKAQRIAPQDPTVLTAYADTLIHLGALEEKTENFHDAKEKLNQALALNPNLPDPLCLSGIVEVHMGKYFSDTQYIDNAIEIFKKGLNNHRSNAHFWHGLATAHYTIAEINQDVGEYEKAAKFCSQAIRLSPSNSSYWNDWGVSLMKIGDITNDRDSIAQAVEKFEEAVRIHHRKNKSNPDPDWLYNYGCAFDFLGEFDQNPQHYERAISILLHLHNQFPDASHVRYNLAIAFYHLGDAAGDEEALERALEHLEHLYNKDSEDDTVITDLGLVCLTLGDLYRDSFNNQTSSHHLERAEQYLMQALAAGSLEANYWLACLYAIQENFADAMHFLERSKQTGALPTVQDLLTNDWLDELKKTPSFNAFLNEIIEE